MITAKCRRCGSENIRKNDQVWIWPAMERQTRRTAGVAFGDCSAKTCRNL